MMNRVVHCETGAKVAGHVYENPGAGRVADLILREARKWRADVIVMGTHGRRGISHASLGSDAETVVRSSPVPVLLVRGKTAVRTTTSVTKRK